MNVTFPCPHPKTPNLIGNPPYQSFSFVQDPSFVMLGSRFAGWNFPKWSIKPLQEVPKRVHLKKYQMENYSAMLGWSSILPGNPKVKSLPPGQVEISSWQTEII